MDGAWGFCERCELWQLADWRRPPACPVCGAEPRPLEEIVDGVGRVSLVLDLPPGSELPLLG